MPLPEHYRSMEYSDRDEFGLLDEEYATPDSIRLLEELLGIFGYIGLQPIAYQLGDRFYHTERKQTFTVHTPYTLRACHTFIGTRVLWLPTVDEIMKQLMQDEIRLSLITSGNGTNYIYRTYIFDPLFPAERGYHPFRHTSRDLWVALAFPVAKSYKRRFDVLGLDSVRKTIYTSDKDLADSPISIIDQTNIPVITNRRGLKKNAHTKADNMERTTRKSSSK